MCTVLFCHSIDWLRAPGSVGPFVCQMSGARDVLVLVVIGALLGCVEAPHNEDNEDACAGAECPLSVFFVILPFLLSLVYLGMAWLLVVANANTNLEPSNPSPACEFCDHDLHHVSSRGDIKSHSANTCPVLKENVHVCVRTCM